MGREVRKVPANWEHPKDESGSYIPLYGGSYSEKVREWDEGEAQWKQGLRSDYKGGWKPLNGTEGCQSYEEWDGDRPVSEEYMPDWPEAERTHYQMYENTSEGTPISPVFATPEELARWLADTGASACGDMTASYEAWLRVARGGFAPSMVIVNGRVMSGVDGL